MVSWLVSVKCVTVQFAMLSPFLPAIRTHSTIGLRRDPHPWFVRSGLPRNDYRDDLVSWIQNLQPYIKNGAPTRPATVPFQGLPPNGLMRCPSFSEERWRRMAEMPDCDGPGALANWVPIRLYHAHYGIGFGVQGGGCWYKRYYAIDK